MILLRSSLSTVVFLSLFIVQGCIQQNNSDNKSISNNSLSNNSLESFWKYSEKQDAMTSKTIKYAEVYSSNLVEFGFPYQGGTTGRILIRRKDGIDEILFSIDKGQFNSSPDKIRLRFDENPPIVNTISRTSDGSSNVLFIDNSSNFIQNMKNAQKLKIEAEFFREGNKVFEFNVKDLKW